MKSTKFVDANTKKRMRKFYETSEVYKGLLDAHDEIYLRSYIELVCNYANPNSSILELGCGNGLSARLLKDRGHRVVGTDLSSSFLADTVRSEDGRLRYLTCDALHLPFNEETFDLVCSHEMIEHVTDAERALGEMSRVVKPGGRIIVAGPNLCSPLVPLTDFFRHRSFTSLEDDISKISGISYVLTLFLRNRLALRSKKKSIWAETKLQAISGAWRNFWLCVKKRFSKKPDFLYREPDLEDQAIGGDADSVYYASPIDLEKFFKSNGLELVKLAVGYGIKGKLMAKVFPRFGLYISMVVEKK